MLLGITAINAGDEVEKYLLVPKAAAVTNVEIHRQLWSGVPRGIYDSGWKTKAAGYARVLLSIWPQLGGGPGVGNGTPVDAFSGSGSTLSPVDPAGNPNPTSMTLDDVTAGVWDGLWLGGFANIAATYPNAILNLCPEMYGPGWWPHSGIGLGYKNRDAYRHLVTLARSASSTFEFNWNGGFDLHTVHGYGPTDIANFYPGDSYVDYISADVYDTFAGGDGVASWATRAPELDVGVAFAKTHGKPFCINEWGLQNIAQTGFGNDDDPAFIQEAYKWCRTNEPYLANVNFFNDGPGDSDYSGGLWDGGLWNNPQSAATFKALFGSWARQLAGATTHRFVTPGFGQIGGISLGGPFVHGRANGLKTLAVSPVAVGNVLVLTILNVGFSGTVSSVSGGGVTTWTKLAGSNPGALEGDTEIWYGTVTTAGAATITASSIQGGATALGCQEFTIGTPATWAVDTTAVSTDTTQAASGNYPSVTPTGLLELYVGAATLPGGVVGGTTAGFTYKSGGVSFESSSQFIYRTSPPAGMALSPGWTQTSGYWSAVAGTIKATAVTVGGGSHRLRRPPP